MKQVIAMHGWCSDLKYWDIWEKEFKSNGWYWESADRGYSNQSSSKPHWKKNMQNIAPNKNVLICHSLGPYLIANKVISKATHIIFLNSFSRFIPVGKESRALRIALQGMQKKLLSMQEKNMIKLFWEKASFPHALKEVDPELLNKDISKQGLQKLKSDLELLINTESLPQGINKDTKVLVLDGEKDAIVLPEAKRNLIEELTEHLIKKPEHWIMPNEGHVILLPQTIKKTRLWLESS